jgi:hypothetical protein
MALGEEARFAGGGGGRGRRAADALQGWSGGVV